MKNATVGPNSLTVHRVRKNKKSMTSKEVAFDNVNVTICRAMKSSSQEIDAPFTVIIGLSAM
jgi:hypothetical protein